MVYIPDFKFLTKYLVIQQNPPQAAFNRQLRIESARTYACYTGASQFGVIHNEE